MKRPLTDTSTTKDAAGMTVDIYIWNLSHRTHRTSEKLSLALKKKHQRLTKALLMAKPGSRGCVCSVSQSVVKMMNHAGIAMEQAATWAVIAPRMRKTGRQEANRIGPQGIGG